MTCCQSSECQQKNYTFECFIFRHLPYNERTVRPVISKTTMKQLHGQSSQTNLFLAFYIILQMQKIW